MPTSMHEMLRPRHEFPTPLFRLVVPLVVAGIVALAIYLLR
jgi:hypothetical protein